MSFVGDIIGGIFGREAADEQSDAIRAGQDQAERIYQDIVRRNQPRENIGNQALAQLGGMYGLNLGPAATTGSAAQYSNGVGFGSNPYGSPTARNAQGVMGRFGSGFGGFADRVVADAPQDGFAGFGNLGNLGGGFGGFQITPPTAGDAGAFGNGTTQDRFSDFYNSPDYLLAFDEGQDAIESSAAARGGLLSGATAKAITGYGQDRATNLFGNYRNTLNNIAGLGQQAGQNSSSAAQNFGNQFMAGQAGIGAANANGQLAFGNAFGSAANGLGNFILAGSGG